MKKPNTKLAPPNTATNMQRIKATEVAVNAYYQMPRFLFTADFVAINNDCRVSYCLIRDRFSLSMKNGWVDEDGHVYLYYKIEDLQKAMGLSKPTVLKTLKTLEEHGLIQTVRQGHMKPNRIYLLTPTHLDTLPDDSYDENPDAPQTDNDYPQEVPQETAQESPLLSSQVHEKAPQTRINSGSKKSLLHEVKNIDFMKSNIFTSRGQNSLPHEVKNFDPSYYKYNNKQENQLSIAKSEGEQGRSPTPPTHPDPPVQPPKPMPTTYDEFHTYGEFQQVVLTPPQYQDLLASLGMDKLNDYINRVDLHLSSTGKRYKCHYATIKKWVSEDDRKQATSDRKQATSDKSRNRNRFMNFTNQREYSSSEIEKLERLYLQPLMIQMQEMDDDDDEQEENDASHNYVTNTVQADPDRWRAAS